MPKITTPILIALIVVAFLIGIPVGYILSGGAGVSMVGLQGEIPIGVLVDLTGVNSGWGTRAKAAVEYAESEINNFTTTTGIPVKFKFYYEDTESNPDTTLTKAQALVARGIKVLVGGIISANLRAIGAYVDSNRIVTITGHSIAPRESISRPVSQGGYVFRLQPSCEFEALALKAALLSLSHKYVATLVVKDIYSLSIADACEKQWKAAGIETIARVEYSPGTTEFSAELQALENAVAPYVQQYGADKVVIFADVCEEIIQILDQASKRNSPLLDLFWWSADSFTLSAVVPQYAGALAVKVKLPALTYEVAFTPKFEKINNYAKAKIGQELEGPAILAYDGAWIAALSILVAGKYDGEAIRNVVPSIAERYYGISGYTELNEDGDRAMMNLAFYQVVEENGGYKWVKTATYDASQDKFEWIKAP